MTGEKNINKRGGEDSVVSYVHSILHGCKVVMHKRAHRRLS